MWQMQSSELLPISLSAAVPLWIAGLQDRGGPTDKELDELRGFRQELSEHGDRLLFGGKPGEAADMFNRLARSIAILSYCPGGITVFGQHYETITEEPKEG